MNLRVAPLVQIIKANEWLLREASEDLAAADFTRRIADRGNSYAWIFGHIVGSRYMMARLVGLEGTYPYSELFSREGAHPTAEQLPQRADIERQWEQISSGLSDRLGQLTDADLDADSGRDFPTGDRSVGGALAFFCLHESYHVGQLGYLRVLLGYPPVVK